MGQLERMATNRAERKQKFYGSNPWRRGMIGNGRDPRLAILLGLKGEWALYQYLKGFGVQWDAGFSRYGDGGTDIKLKDERRVQVKTVRALPGRLLLKHFSHDKVQPQPFDIIAFCADSPQSVLLLGWLHKKELNRVGLLERCKLPRQSHWNLEVGYQFLRPMRRLRDEALC